MKCRTRRRSGLGVSARALRLPTVRVMTATLISIAVATLVGCPSPLRAIDPKWVAMLVRLGPPFAPIVIASDGAAGWVLVDGAHRVHAAVILGISMLDARIVSASNETELLEAALRANRAKRLSATERREAALRLLKVSPAMTNRRIADLAGVHHKTIGHWRSELGACATSDRRIGRDGKCYPASHRARQRDARSWWRRLLALLRRLLPSSGCKEPAGSPRKGGFQA